jgi:hypothetical protein
MTQVVSGSDRACESWMADYDIPGADGLLLHHFYRAMACLGEELPAAARCGSSSTAGSTRRSRRRGAELSSLDQPNRPASR